MLGRTYDNQVCSAARALEIAGERWSLLILRNAAFAGMTRFTEFQSQVAAEQQRFERDIGLLECPVCGRALARRHGHHGGSN